VTETDFSAFSDQYLKYSFNLMFQIYVTFSWCIFIKASISLELLRAQYVYLSFDSTNTILTFVAIKVAMSNNIIEACNSLLSLQDLSSLESSSMIKLSTAHKLIVKSSFYIYILTRLKYLSWTFQLDLNTWVEHLNSTWYRSWVESELADSTQLVKQSNMMSRELNIEIFPVFSPLHYLFALSFW